MMKTINPATGNILKEYEEMSFETVDRIITRANEEQRKWKRYSYAERADFLRKLAVLLEEQKEDLAMLMTREMGKPLAQSVGEIEKCAWVCTYYADEAEGFLADEPVQTEATKSYVHFEALGVVLSIMPWNFPFWQLFRFAVPALMAGNGVILSHSQNTTGCALEMERLMHDVGIAKDLFRTILVTDEHMKPVIQHDGIAAVTLTGSTRAGKIVAAQAGEKLKKTVLELGGSDPYLILEDANIPEAAKTCVTSRLINSGQSCIAAKRFIVVESVYEAFVDEFSRLMKAKQVGDPLAEATEVGPLARKDLREQLHSQVLKSVEAGAKLSLGGELPEGEGAFYPVTILENVKPGMPAYEEELFGPVAAIIKVSDEQEAIKVANDTPYGLGAAVFSEDLKRAERIAAEELEAGCCFVNEFVKSDPRLPFGGIKHSGYGRELGLYGIHEFVNTKTIYIR